MSKQLSVKFAEATCLECGCTDSDAGDAGCAWRVVSRLDNLGVCFGCAGARSMIDLTRQVERKVWTKAALVKRRERLERAAAELRNDMADFSRMNPSQSFEPLDPIALTGALELRDAAAEMLRVCESSRVFPNDLSPAIERLNRALDSEPLAAAHLKTLERAISSISGGRCFVCGWTLSPDGCKPFLDCSARPTQHRAEYAGWHARLVSLGDALQWLSHVDDPPPQSSKAASSARHEAIEGVVKILGGTAYHVPHNDTPPSDEDAQAAIREHSKKWFTNTQLAPDDTPPSEPARVGTMTDEKGNVLFSSETPLDELNRRPGAGEFQEAVLIERLEARVRLLEGETARLQSSLARVDVITDVVLHKRAVKLAIEIVDGTGHPSQSEWLWRNIGNPATQEEIYALAKAVRFYAGYYNARTRTVVLTPGSAARDE